MENDVYLATHIPHFRPFTNSIVYLDESKSNYRFKVLIYNNSLLYVGKHCFFNSFDNSKTYFFVYEHQNIVIGDRCLVSYGCSFRNSDAHLIYDVTSSKRINLSKSIIVGDHVWIGQNSLILKGTIIGSGAIIGANSLVSGKKITSNTIWAGNPARELRNGIYWLPTGCMKWVEEETQRFSELSKKDNRFVYVHDPQCSLIDNINNITITDLLKVNKNRFSV